MIAYLLTQKFTLDEAYKCIFSFQPNTKLFLNGEFVESKTTDWIDLHNPVSIVLPKLPGITKHCQAAREKNFGPARTNLLCRIKI